jgi:hypothetical protein
MSGSPIKGGGYDRLNRLVAAAAAVVIVMVFFMGVIGGICLDEASRY